MPILFSTIKLGNIEVRNRFMRSATVECLATKDGKVSERYTNLYTALARGGVGLIVTGNFIVQKNGISISGSIIIDNDDVITGLNELTSKVHEHGAKIIAQVNHTGRLANTRASGLPAIAPSAVLTIAPTLNIPKAMTEAEIENTIESFASAAYRVKTAGFDGVQFHCAHGYLIHQFLSPHTNRRKDKWNGSLDDRMRFLTEIINRTRAKVGKDFPLLVKFNSSDLYSKGLSLNDSIYICKKLEALGIQAIEVSGGTQETGGLVITRGEFPSSITARGRALYEKIFLYIMAPFIRKEGVFKENYFLENAKKIKQAVKIPVMVVGGIRNAADMEKIIQNNDADMISMCRPFIRKIDLVNTILHDNNYISTCTSCNRCTLEILTQGNIVKCYYKH